jgi:hypothetical protein
MVRALRWLVGAVGVLALSCTSPTLPLPPPTNPQVTAGADANHVHLSSVAGSEPNALIVVVNRNTDLARNLRVSGTIADDQGSWDLEVYAHANDTIDISQEVGAVRSPSATIVVK